VGWTLAGDGCATRRRNLLHCGSLLAVAVAGRRRGKKSGGGSAELAERERKTTEGEHGTVTPPRALQDPGSGSSPAPSPRPLPERGRPDAVRVRVLDDLAQRI